MCKVETHLSSCICCHQDPPDTYSGEGSCLQVIKDCALSCFEMLCRTPPIMGRESPELVDVFPLSDELAEDQRRYIVFVPVQASEVAAKEEPFLLKDYKKIGEKGAFRAL